MRTTKRKNCQILKIVRLRHSSSSRVEANRFVTWPNPVVKNVDLRVVSSRSIRDFDQFADCRTDNGTKTGCNKRLFVVAFEQSKSLRYSMLSKAISCCYDALFGLYYYYSQMVYLQHLFAYFYYYLLMADTLLVKFVEWCFLLWAYAIVYVRLNLLGS